MIKRLLSLLWMLSICVPVLFIAPHPAQAFVSETGTFTATASCPALSSIRRRTNPGNINVSPDVSYPLLGKNKQEATHYQIRIAGAEPTSRWVEVSCGSTDTRVTTEPSDQDSSQNAGQDYVLAASWQPGFCETKPDKTECRSQTGDRFDATAFSIHGLWPRPQYCNVSSRIQQLDEDRRWSELPPLDLSPDLRQELAIKMPGYASDLHLHEWYKHGTCYSETPEEYYQDTILLLDQLNASDVRTLLVQNLEQDITNEQVDQAFESAFGVTGKATLSCKRFNRETLIDEVLINLRGEIDLDTDIADLLAAAPNVSNMVVRNQCPRGIGQVDSADD